MTCRHCGRVVTLPFANLGTAPPSNAYLPAERLKDPERFYPLRVLVCEGCWLVQTEDFASASELFDAEYAYFSGFSRTWLAHAEQYVRDMIVRFELGPRSHVVEVAANDGYLLQYVRSSGIRCTGIEPTASTAAAARAKGIPIVEAFFGRALARELVARGARADLMVANNVLAHVPDINDFVGGFAEMLQPQGVATFEFPHVYRLIIETQFDTIYHEHYSYLSLTSVDTIFAANGLAVFDVEELSTHGGSLRVFAQPAASGRHTRSDRYREMLAREAGAGMTTPAYYAGFQQQAERVKNDFLRFLLDAARDGKRVAGYGAAAKGNTLMNFAGIRADLVALVADANPAKQGKYLPGSRIPVVPEARLRDARPDFVVIFPWNLASEISAQLSYVRDWGGRFVTAVPRLAVS